MKSTAHSQRVKRELRAAGASNYSTAKFASKYLPTVIHDDESIGAVVYGRYREDSKLLSLTAGMLVATDRRIIFLDHKPGYTSMDELTYDVVSGVKKTTNGLKSTVTLHTRVGDYIVRYANSKAADKFVHYIESRRLEAVEGMPVVESKQLPMATAIDKQAVQFLQEHDLAVMSTADRDGKVHGAVVYYALDQAKYIYVLTKAGTQKARDIFVHQQVALTVYDVSLMQTVQLQGIADVETNQAIQQKVFAALVKPRFYKDTMDLPPVTKLHEESYVVIRITPTVAHFTDFNKRT